MYLLVMTKYLGKQILSLGRFPKSKRRRKKERLNDGNNNGQLRIANATSDGARKSAWANLPENGINGLKVKFTPLVWACQVENN